ncbi:ceramide glucosyltransferase [Polyangium fumosum]|uniref:Glycosyl transferase n=1 Tax=Polyangium fumosum TaxID=889272 RepID=A0A4U1J7I6_9BACT|nr:ceramide glucosyltransferase [Polyangium fumosum]TKD03309.1 glycosyl transferase [Polyangium fumosum]
MKSTLVALLAGGALSSIVMTVASQGAALRILRRAPAKERPTPPITILKPLKGVDDGLRENLLSFASQDYPTYEVLLGAEDADDPALVVAREVMARCPRAPFSIVHCPRRTGLNPKVSILEALAARARHEHVLISDSNVRVGPGYLGAMAAELADPRVGLVTSVIVGAGERTVGAALENLHLNSFIVRSTLAAKVFLGHACVIGKSMLLRRGDLAAVGGFASVRDVLAEDYLLGKAFQEAGFRVALSTEPVRTVNERWRLDRFVSRHVRWTQMRRRVHVGSYLVEPLFNPVPLLLLLSLVAGGALGGAALFGVALKIALDAALWSRLRGARMSWPCVSLVPFKDVLATFTWVVGGVRRTVDWRGHRMRIGEGTRLEAIDVAATVDEPAEVAPRVDQRWAA